MVSQLLCFRANSIAKHSFSSVTISVMYGLLEDLLDTEAIAISTALQTELLSKSPCNLVSTIHFTSPFASIDLTHSLIAKYLLWIQVTRSPRNDSCYMCAAVNRKASGQT
ncbi:hypothetical protein Ahy_A09g046373 [Arachis hypogaea]|uniref:Uncharacterized protein n=1 Tax=Arachis hypogaea TaxID=3818 RepID=A0A445BPP8_ARAHY|nr:hypothetical protein Ahy_A09g046373 [Arachis hypogaea]